MANGASAQRRREQEVEEMGTYLPEELNQYEFKIVRSLSGNLGNPKKFQQLLQEESQAGWQLVEKLDDRRVRFKRLISAREKDAMLPEGMDPYRSYFGMKPQQYIMRVFIITLGGILLLCAFWYAMMAIRP